MAVVMDDALRDRVVAELRRGGYGGLAPGDVSDAQLRRFAETSFIGASIALRLALYDLVNVLMFDTWPGRLLMRLVDVTSRALARQMRRPW